MGVRKKRNTESVNSSERRDKGFSVFLVFVIILLIATPIVLFIFNPFGWNITPITDNIPSGGEVTPSNKKTYSVTGKELITSSSTITNPQSKFETTYSKDGYEFTIAFATNSMGTVQLGAVSNPQYIYYIEDDEDPYQLMVGVKINNNSSYKVTSISAYTSNLETSKLKDVVLDEEYEGARTVAYNKLPTTLKVHHVTFTIEPK